MAGNKGSKRLTLADIGRHCGYHYSTVGYALRNHPSIPEKTKAYIRRVADELGYRPDPTLASLVAYRKQKRDPNFRTTIGVIVDGEEKASAWRDPSKKHFSSLEYWKGMKERAEELGYRLEEFSVGLKRQFEKRVDKILHARGISAVIVAPVWNTDDPISLSWERLSAITIGYSLASPHLPRITHQHRAGAQTAVRKMVDLGYRRLALMLPYEYDERVSHAWSAGFYGECKLLGIEEECLTYMPRNHPRAWTDDCLDWLENHHPEAVLTPLQHFHEFLVSHEIEVPHHMGLVMLDLPSMEIPLTGIYQNSFIIGREAVNMVSSCYINHIRGLLDYQHIHVIKGQWNQGSSTRPLSEHPARSS
jgi:DNA-binding LacI/PurR family transcriptional regulator